jgi:hypothetical protein
MQADKLIQEYKVRGHPLGEAIRLGETGELISLLRIRLGATDSELDLSPPSLKRLEKKLVEYHQTLQSKSQQLTDDETVQLVREIAAYLGVVRLRHAQAIWREGRSLWDTSVEVAGPIKVIKGARKYTGNSLTQLLGNQAASAWDVITQGKPTRLYSSYLSLRRKVAKQDLSKRGT